VVTSSNNLNPVTVIGASPGNLGSLDTSGRLAANILALVAIKFKSAGKLKVS